MYPGSEANRPAGIFGTASQLLDRRGLCEYVVRSRTISGGYFWGIIPESSLLLLLAALLKGSPLALSLVVFDELFLSLLELPLLAGVVEGSDIAYFRLHDVILGRRVSDDAVKGQDWLLEAAWRHGGQWGQQTCGSLGLSRRWLEVL